MKILILTNGEYGDYSFCKALEPYDYVICADNGMGHARQLGIMPNMILGDFDSCNSDDLEYFANQGVLIQSVPSVKDETDTELAVTTALHKGARSITVLGGVGTRMDHSLGNIHLLKKTLDLGVEMWLVNDHNHITLISQQITLNGDVGQTVSLLPLTMEVTGIYTKGLAYAVSDGVFTLGQPIGVSNEMVASEAEIRIASGLLLVMKTND